MGKQVNYWMGYGDFLRVAQTALDCNCVIIKEQGKKVDFGNSLDIVTETTHRYYFLPLEMNVEEKDYLHLDALRSNCQVIEAGFSYILHDKKEIMRSRIYVDTGYYNEQGQYMPRSEVLTSVYNKLVRTVKKLAPYTELVDTQTGWRDLKKTEYRHKEYVTPECLDLREMQNYKLRA